jgi:hypothetical protein
MSNPLDRVVAQSGGTTNLPSVRLKRNYEPMFVGTRS